MKDAKSSSSLSNIASLLSAARKDKGLSIEEVTQKIKVKSEYLLKIEQGNFTFLPAPYVYAMLKQYASFLELDAKLVTQCRHELNILTDEALNKLVASNNEEQNDLTSVLANPEYRKWGLIAAAALGVILIFFIVINLFSGSSEPELVVKKVPEASISVQSKKEAATLKQADAKPTAPVKAVPPPKKTPAKEQPPKKPEAAKAEQPKPAQPKPDPPKPASVPPSNEPTFTGATKTLLIKTLSDTSWIKVVSDGGENSREGLIPPEQFRQYEASRDFEITVGRAEAVQIFLNGKPVTLPRRNGWIKFNVGN